MCTDGTSNGIIFTCDADFQQAVTISAILAYKLGLRIICYCHMTNHSHFVVACKSEATAKNFIDGFKRDYAVYMNREYGISKIFKEIDTSIKEITERNYLRNCISYVLLNPVAAKICRVPEEYRYSSFGAYFQEKPIMGYPVQKLKNREQRKWLKTNADLSGAGYILNSDNSLNILSVIDFKFVENLFGSKTWFYKSLALTNSVDEELIYAPKVCRYSDIELFEEIAQISQKRYGRMTFHTLTKSEKFSLIPTIERKTRVSPRRLARILRLDNEEVENIMGVEHCRYD